jgi:hypothetical protein
MPESVQRHDLNCWMLGDKPHQVVTINVSRDTKVSAFPGLIKDKNKPALDHLSATSFELWEVSERL